MVKDSEASNQLRLSKDYVINLMSSVLILMQYPHPEYPLARCVSALPSPWLYSFGQAVRQIFSSNNQLRDCSPTP